MDFGQQCLGCAVFGDQFFRKVRGVGHQPFVTLLDAGHAAHIEFNLFAIHGGDSRGVLLAAEPLLGMRAPSLQLGLNELATFAAQLGRRPFIAHQINDQAVVVFKFGRLPLCAKHFKIQVQSQARVFERKWIF